MRQSLALAEVPQPEDRAVKEFETSPELQVVPGLGLEEAISPTRVLSSVPDFVEQAPTELKQGHFINADSVPELFIKRQKAEQTAKSALAYNSHLLHNGRAADVPTPVNALGTAHQVVKVKRELGPNSPEYKEMYTGLELDKERLTGEASSKNDPEHFGRARRTFEPKTREHYSHGLSITKMTRNGLSPLGEPEEQQRRIPEYVEENGTLVPIGGIIADIGLQGLVELLPIPVEQNLPEVTVHVTTVSRCAAYAKRDFAINPKGSHGGYRPAMDGMAIRRTHFEDNSGDREDEHAIISGIYITQDIIEEVLVEDGVIEPGQTLTIEELLGTQLISINDGSVMEFVKRLDEKASAAHGINLFMGEVVPDDHSKDYYEFIDQAEERKKKLAPIPTQLADFVIDLEEKGTDSRVAEALVNKFLKDKLLARAKKNPTLAEAMFDKATADGFAEVARLEASGRSYEASLRLIEVKENAPEVSYCSGGGCAELDDVDSSSPAGILAKSLGLQGRMVRNKEAACKNCRAKQLHHDYNGNTVCTNCKSTKLSGQGIQQGTGNNLSVSSLDEKRKTSKKAAAREKASPPEKAGKVVPLRPQPPKQPPAA